MDRVNGFIDVDKLLNIPKREIYDVTELLKFLLKNNNTVVVRKRRMNSQFVFSFDYNGETYYFKFDSFVNPYNELIFYYLALDMGINSLPYDIAKLGVYEGVISKDFKVPGAKYISGRKILNISHGKDFNKYNTLEDIWADLEDYFKNRKDRQKIVAKLMDKLVRIFIFDLLIGQEDRYPDNWGIVKYPNGEVDLQINLDNSRALVDHPIMARHQLRMNNDDLYAEDMIENFLRVSSDEFSSVLLNYLWIISKENILKTFEKIEAQTGYPMPDELKDEYLKKFEIYYYFFEDLLDDLKTQR